jgi:site-specific recombinase XerC
LGDDSIEHLHDEALLSARQLLDALDLLLQLSYLGVFIAWCTERGLATPREITKPILERYQRSLYTHRKANGEPLTFRAQHARLIPVRAFFKWLARQNYLLYNPASELELPRFRVRLISVHSACHPSPRPAGPPGRTRRALRSH